MENNSVGGETYQWFFMDGATSIEFNPTHVFPDSIFGDQLTLVSDDLPQPIITPNGKELPYNFNGYTVNGQSYVYSGFFSL